MSQQRFRLKLDKAYRQRWVQHVQELSPDINPETIRLMDKLRMVSHALYQKMEQSLDESGVSFARYRVLMLLHHAELDGKAGLNPSEISEYQGTSRNTISALIRDLEAEALVERHLDKQDRRKFKICLTDNGRAFTKEHAHRHLKIADRCFTTLSPDEQAKLESLLEKVGQGILEQADLEKQ